MYIRKELITPEIAQQMLDTNFRNRNIRENIVRMLAKQMQNGEFIEDSPNMISIDTKGRLIDGQHRLAAIIRSGLSFRLYVAYDVPSNSIIDRGVARTVQDSLYMRGYIDKKFSRRCIISLSRYYIQVINNYADVRRITDNEIYEIINKYGDYIEKSDKISQKGSGRPILRRSYWQCAILAAIIKGVDIETLERFAYIVNTGFSNSNRESAAIVFRNNALSLNNKNTKFEEKLRQTQMCECAIRDFVSSFPRKNAYTKVSHVYIDVEGD